MVKLYRPTSSLQPGCIHLFILFIALHQQAVMELTNSLVRHSTNLLLHGRDAPKVKVKQNDNDEKLK